jgi:hypothetical protein
MVITQLKKSIQHPFKKLILITYMVQKKPIQQLF